MARCNKCGTDVGCPCNLVSGLCNRCRFNNIEKQEKKETEPILVNKNYCGLELEDLHSMLAILNQKEILTKEQKYHRIILRSQINIFSKTPCKFYDIIKKINVN